MHCKRAALSPSSPPLWASRCRLRSRLADADFADDTWWNALSSALSSLRSSHRQHTHTHTHTHPAHSHCTTSALTHLPHRPPPHHLQYGTARLLPPSTAMQRLAPRLRPLTRRTHPLLCGDSAPALLTTPHRTLHSLRSTQPVAARSRSRASSPHLHSRSLATATTTASASDRKAGQCRALTVATAAAV